MASVMSDSVIVVLFSYLDRAKHIATVNVWSGTLLTNPVLSLYCVWVALHSFLQLLNIVLAASVGIIMALLASILTRCGTYFGSIYFVNLSSSSLCSYESTR